MISCVITNIIIMFDQNTRSVFNIDLDIHIDICVVIFSGHVVVRVVNYNVHSISITLYVYILSMLMLLLYMYNSHCYGLVILYKILLCSIKLYITFTKVIIISSSC